MVSVCTVPARGGRSCEHFDGYKTINRIPLPLRCDLQKIFQPAGLRDPYDKAESFITIFKAYLLMKKGLKLSHNFILPNLSPLAS